MLYNNRIRDLSVELDHHIKRRKGKSRASPETFMMTEADLAAYIGCKGETARKFLNEAPRICIDGQRLYMTADVVRRLYQLEIDSAVDGQILHIMRSANKPSPVRVREIREDLEYQIAALKFPQYGPAERIGPEMLTVSDLMTIMKRSNKTICKLVYGLPRIQSGKNIYYHIRDVATRLAQLEMEAAS